MQNFGVTNKEYYGMLWYFLEWSIPSSPGPLYQNEGKCSAFDVEMLFHSHAN